MWDGFSTCKNKMFAIKYTYLQFLKASMSLNGWKILNFTPSESTAVVIFFTVF